MASTSIDSVVLSRYDSTKKWECGSAEGSVVIGQTPEVFVCMHPVKLGYMHFVIVPKGRAPGAELTKKDASLVKALHKAARDVVAKYQSPAACRKFLFKQKGKFQGDERVREAALRWAGPNEIEAFGGVYGSKDVPYTLGFEAYAPVVADLHLHVISKDFAYIDDEDDWNMYTTDWGLMPPATLAELLEGDAPLDFPSSKDMNDMCEEHDLVCYHTGKTLPSVKEARTHAIYSLLGKEVPKPKIEEREREGPKTDEGHELVTSVDFAPAADYATLGTEKVVQQFEDRKKKPPVKPSKKYKPVKASVLSAFGKWCEYYYHLKYVGEEEGQDEAAEMMRELANHSIVTQSDMVTFNQMQVKCRDMFFGGKPDAKRPRAQWDGDKVGITNGEAKKPKFDAERCPF